MKLNIGRIIKSAAKVAAPLIVGMLVTKGQREIERQAEKLIRKTDKL